MFRASTLLLHTVSKRLLAFSPLRPFSHSPIRMSDHVPPSPAESSGTTARPKRPRDYPPPDRDAATPSATPSVTPLEAADTPLATPLVEQQQPARSKSAGGERVTASHLLRIKGVPPYDRHKGVMKALKGVVDDLVHVYKEGNQRTALLLFRSEEAVAKARESLEGFVWKKGYKIHAEDELGSVPWKKLIASHKIAQDSASILAKRKARVVTRGPAPADLPTVARRTCPLIGEPYERQLEMKRDTVVNALTDISRRLRKAWVASSRSETATGEMPRLYGDASAPLVPCCPLMETPNGLGIYGSPVQSGYRNKNEFSIGTNAVSGDPCVGFVRGSFRDNYVSIERDPDLPHVSEKSLRAAEVMEKVVVESKLPVWDSLENDGFWRMMTTRESDSDGDILVIAHVDETGLQRLVRRELGGDAADSGDVERETLRRLEDAKAGCRDGFRAAKEGGRLPELSGVLWTHTAAMTTSADPNGSFTLLHGSPYIHDTVCGARFRISASAFFQTNTRAATLLYERVGALAGVGPADTILDVCCGTGTIGISLARVAGVARVVGVEMCAQAVEDARENAERNGVANTTWVCGKAEDTLDQTIDATGDTQQSVDPAAAASTDPALSADAASADPEVGGVRGKCVAIVDPPRSGLHTSVLQALRSAQHIDRLVYVSCKPQSLVDNVTALCRPHSGVVKGQPWKPVKAVAVDMFPHTDHVETVMLLERPN